MSEGYRVAYHGTLRNTGIRLTLSSQFQNNYFTEMCSGSEAGAYSRLTGFVYHSTPGLRVIKKKKKTAPEYLCQIRSADDSVARVVRSILAHHVGDDIISKRCFKTRFYDVNSPTTLSTPFNDLYWLRTT